MIEIKFTGNSAAEVIHDVNEFKSYLPGMAFNSYGVNEDIPKQNETVEEVKPVEDKKDYRGEIIALAKEKDANPYIKEYLNNNGVKTISMLSTELTLKLIEELKAL